MSQVQNSQGQSSQVQNSQGQSSQLQNKSPQNKLAQKYQKKTDKQHVLDNPDTYIGSVEKVDTENWLLKDNQSPDITSHSIIYKSHNYIPGLFKLFDEGIVNARDHVVRMQTQCTNQVTYIAVDITEDGVITMTNDGDGIDVAIHPEHQVYIPELIFGHLRTSTNYDKTEKKIVGGKNGFGFKLVLIWSEWGSVETIDHTRGLKYNQSFKNNLDIIEKPTITKCKKKPYTKITFKPDYKRLGIENLDADMRALLKKRVYDIAAITDKAVKVKFNSQVVPVKNFQQYVDLYIGSKADTKRIYEEANERWEYAVCLTPNDEFTQVSFVNGIHTSKGGKHVEYILNQITRKLVAYIKQKRKVDVKPNTLKEQLMLFVNCSVENPSFDSQTKDFMNTPVNKFGSTCEVSEKFIEKIAAKSGLGVMDVALALTQVKENKEVKKTDGSKVKSIRGIPKLVDANYAGTEKSQFCTLILCEGDSAKAGVISGLSKTDRDIYGVYPMRGKLLNVRDETTKKIADNKEIAELKTILGLESGKKYTQEEINKKLRYNKVMFMTDQDLDGSHIKGLGINLFDSLWNSLIQIPGFIGFMNTPIIKAKKGAQELLFYNDGEYEAWKSNPETNTKGWNVKYYKGLGTSTSAEFKEYFKNKKVVGFEWTAGNTANSIDKVFNKKRADDRKDWLGEYNRENYLDTNQPLIKYEEFVDREMIHFSKYDCDRSIPNLMDGLKISQRKILYAAFKKRLTTEIKVAQFSGYVSEHSAYHHGEASLNGAIVGMAQNFVGSNNINVMEPKGQFGTRLQGGKDSASERYIFTHLAGITRNIYRESDDKILKYLDDDGYPVEPVYYAPIIPMLLVNGSKGIGTGFSTDIPCYNPLEIIRHIKVKLIDNTQSAPVAFDGIPYYEGFNGTIAKQQDSAGNIENNKFIIKGTYEFVGEDKIRITELPVGTWTDDYKLFLENQIADKKSTIIKDFEDNSTECRVDITIKCVKTGLQELKSKSGETTITDTASDTSTNDINEIEKYFKLTSKKTTTNMHAFTGEEKLKKYTNPNDIINDFFETRLQVYKTRKAAQLEDSKAQLKRISNKVKYIVGILGDKIDLRRKKQTEINHTLTDFGLDKEDDSYNYLVKMPMDSVSEENIIKLKKEHQELTKFIQALEATKEEEIWLKELCELEAEYEKYVMQRKALDVEPEQTGDKKSGKKTNKKIIKKVK